MAKAARLNSNRFRRPTAKPIDELTTAIREEGAQRLIFDQALRFAPRTPCDQIQASSGLSESCPKNADVPKSPFPCSGSPGAVGRHNDTPNRVAFGCGCRKHPTSGAEKMATESTEPIKQSVTKGIQQGRPILRQN